MTIEQEKIENFIKWLKQEKREANEFALGSASSLNIGCSQTYNKVYSKAKKMLLPEKEITKTVK